MNPLFAVALFAAMVSGQDHGSGNCCAPQPITIQLSCNGNRQQQNSPPPPHYPPPPPGGEYMCEFNPDGYPVSSPPGGFPPGFRVTPNEQGMPEGHTDDPFMYPLPPKNWDGTLEHLGFPMPQPGTAHYNMLMCTPLPVVTLP